MSTNEILQIVVFSIFFGIAMTAIGEYAKPVLKALDVVSHIILKMVGYVMNFAPFGCVWRHRSGDRYKGTEGVDVLPCLLPRLPFGNIYIMDRAVWCWIPCIETETSISHQAYFTTYAHRF
jgi:hypothetical protein